MERQTTRISTMLKKTFLYISYTFLSINFYKKNTFEVLCEQNWYISHWHGSIWSTVSHVDCFFLFGAKNFLKKKTSKYSFGRNKSKYKKGQSSVWKIRIIAETYKSKFQKRWKILKKNFVQNLTPCMIYLALKHIIWKPRNVKICEHSILFNNRTIICLILKLYRARRLK